MPKTKIELFEEKMVEEGLSDENLLEYEKLLRRVRNDWSRMQHCFLTASRFPVARLDDAVRLVEFGNERYASDPLYLTHSRSMLGRIYMRAEQYQTAYEIFLDIFRKKGNFKGQIPWCLLDAKMHVDRFQYSSELEEYLALCRSENDFIKSFLESRFLLALAEYIVAAHYGRRDEKGHAYATICEMLEPGYTGPLHELLEQHRYEEHLRLTDDRRAFLRKISLTE